MLRFELLSQMIEYQLYICNRKALPKLPLSPTNQRFSKSPKNCDIIFLRDESATNYSYDSADISPKIILDISL